MDYERRVWVIVAAIAAILALVLMGWSWRLDAASHETDCGFECAIGAGVASGLAFWFGVGLGAFALVAGVAAWRVGVPDRKG